MNESKEVKKEIKDLREKIRRYDWYYYCQSDPEVSDREYDRLMYRLKSLEETYPKFITSDSPTQRVSGGVSGGFTTIEHVVKMLSLDNTYSEDEIYSWEEKVKRALKSDQDINYTAGLKIDGVSCSLIYRDGVFVLGSTRGDGQMGEDVSENLKTIKSIPLKLMGKELPAMIGVRGEIYIDKKDFELMNQEKIKNGDSPFANPRNAASGSLKLLDSNLVSKRNLKCFIHSFGWVEGQEFSSQMDFFDQGSKWGLRINPTNKHCKNLKEVIEYYNYWKEKRETLDYEVDGVVVKVNSFSLQQKLGSTLKSPRWAVAYKFPAHQATTKVLQVEFGVGRTGIITPVACLEPVECGGVIIARTTLHNFDEIERLGVKVGDTVLIERAGEVIPKVVKVIESKRTGLEEKINIPKKCPVCREKIVKEKEEEVYWYCTNLDCPARLKGSIMHFVSRTAMDIEGVGESLVDELVNRGIVKSVVDIYKLDQDILLSLPLFKDKKATKTYRAIQKSRGNPLSKFLFGLGIRHIGEKAALTLAQKFRDIDDFFNLKEEDFQGVEEIGIIMAKSLVNFFSQNKIKKMVNELKKLGVNLKEVDNLRKGDKLSGKSFVLTGELESFSRVQAQKIIMELGGKYSSSVSKNTDFVLTGKNPGSKFAKAKKLGVQTIDEDRFKELIK